MAVVRSLGIHQPAALPYLIAEGVLAPDPPRSSYKWRIDAVKQEGLAETVEEEVLATDNCAVWSRAGVVKRVYNLDVEGGRILRAFTTWFPQRKGTSSQRQSYGKQYGTPNTANNVGHVDLKRGVNQVRSLERALIVILKTQVHIFLLSGNSHVIPLSFEVEDGFPAPLGFLLQRKLSINEVKDRNRQEKDLSVADDAFPALPSSLQRHLVNPTVNTGTKPRLFCFSEVLDEVGSVVFRLGEKTDVQDASTSSALSHDEDLVYISSRDELDEAPQDSESPLCLAVTQNKRTRNLTLWHATYVASDSAEPRSKRRKLDANGYVAKRKSSNVFGRTAGAVTPSRTFQSRESFGALAQTFSENVSKPLKNDPRASQTDLEAQLGHEFGEVGVQTRSARRISSMLARTDLMTGHDRSVSNEIAQSHVNRKSINRTAWRGESIGSFGDRQSFGRRRSSFPTNASVMSNGTSFLEMPGTHSFADLNVHEDLQLGLEKDFAEPSGALTPQLAFTKIKTLPRSLKSPPEHQQVSDMPKIFTMQKPRRRDTGVRGSRHITVCLMDKHIRELALVGLKIYRKSKTKNGKQDEDPSHSMPYIRGTEVRRGSNVVDACKVQSGFESRILIMTQTRDQTYLLHLEAPWTTSFRINLPTTLMVYSPTGLQGPASPDHRKVTGQHRVIKTSNVAIDGIENSGTSNEVLITDTEGKTHRMHIQLEPQDIAVKAIMDVCRFVLPTADDDSLVLVWWEVLQWLRGKDLSAELEYTALVVVIFTIVIPFIAGKSGLVPSTPRKKKGGLLRSSSGTAVDMTSWDSMTKDESRGELGAWIGEDSWVWVADQGQVPTPSPETKSHRAKASMSETSSQLNIKKTFIVDCISYAREFLQTPAGESAIGPEGYLPTAMNKDHELRRTAIPSIMVGVHLYREELKLQAHPNSYFVLQTLGPVLAQLGQWLGWSAWTRQEGSYYHTEIPGLDEWLFEDTSIDCLEMPGQPFGPPSIYAYVEQRTVDPQAQVFPSLLDVAGQPESPSASKDLRVSVARLTPRLAAMTGLLGTEDLNEYVFNQCILESLPSGVGEVVRKFLVGRKPFRGPASAKALLEFFGNNDLNTDGASVMHASSARSTMISSHDAIRDYHSVGNIALDTENISSWDASSEIDRHGVTRLIFREDRRYQEASKLVNQTRPPLVECTPEPGWTEGDLLDAQKELAYFVAQRTLSVASGRGMMHFNARVPLVTEKVPIPAFSLQCVMKPRNDAEGSMPMTFSAEKAAFTEDKVCWAFFHNGASAALMISKYAKGIDTSWILYNKPPELTNRHAGFLLALGLTGHLKSLAKWVAFKYLTPKHTMTSIGLLLGLSASYLGTMDTQITRLLSVHVNRLLPLGAAELNLSPLTQATSIMGIGLLYCGSQHRRMSEIMLSEIENNDPEEGVPEESLLRDEGYRLAAGFALGYINLGQGKKLHGLHDMGVVERLLAVGTGTKNLNLVHVLDRATAGATIAVALVFMKTNDESVARKIDIPDTIHQFDYVRPDIFLLRTVARHLIMWDRVEATQTFMRKSLPAAYRHRSMLGSTKYLSTEDMPFFNITAGICLALGLRFAGSGSSQVCELLIYYLDQFIRLTRLPALSYDAKLTRNSVRNCQDVVALATAAVMAGTGDLTVLRRLRMLHSRTDQDTPYGSHLAAHMAIGTLFLGGGTYTFGTSNLAVASLLCAFYPLFPTSVLDNKSHLQAFRHLWALAAEPRCVVCKDSESGKVISVQTEVEMKDGSKRNLVTPCLIPELNEVKQISTKEPGYWDVEVNLENEDVKDNFIRNGLTISLRRRAAYDAPASDKFAAELSALGDQDPAPSISANANAVSFRAGRAVNENPYDWLFSTMSLKDLDVSERALVLPHDSTGNDAGGRIKRTVVDTRLELENIVHSKAPRKDELWQLRLVFAASGTRQEEEQGELTKTADADGSLRQEFIDRLKWKIWNRSVSANEERVS